MGYDMRPWHEQKHDAVMAVADALTVDEQAEFLRIVAEQWPGLRGAHVADVLDIAADHDMFLDVTEPFYEAHEAELPESMGMPYATRALVILGRELTVPAVTGLLTRAGLVPDA